MSERMESVTVQSYLDVHRNEQRDHCQCVQCRIGRDLLDARKEIAEQAEEIERLRKEVEDVRRAWKDLEDHVELAIDIAGRRSKVYVVWLEQAMRSAIRWLECFPEKGNSDAAEQAREELRDALKKAL